MKNHDVIRLAADLISIPSVNPMGSTDPNITGEERIAQFLTDFFRKLRLDVEHQKVEPHRPNVIARFTPAHFQQTIVLAPHLDTVSVANMTIDPFGAKIVGNRLYGRGACDTKGPMAAILWALKNFVEDSSARRCRTKIIFAGLMGEESGNDGARFLMKRGLHADFGVAVEPTGLDIVHTHKGALWFRLITRGKTAHGATPHQGQNAIYKMAQVIEFLSGEYSARLARKSNPLLGRATVNVGGIRGGQQINMVADWCEVEIDRRTLPNESHEKILTGLRMALAKRGLRVETKIIRDCQPLATKANHPMIRLLAQSARKFSPHSKRVGAPWFCDAAIFAAHGIPSVAFGPGRIGKAHTADECIELDQLRQGAEIFLDFFRKL